MIKESFVAQFGEEQANKVMAAAAEHKNGIHDRYGSDPFRWAILICLGYDCLKEYREGHSITVSWEDVQDWMYKHVYDLSRHNGDVDFLALFCGKYDFIAELTAYENYAAVVQNGIAVLLA